jgi:hypothetical protein
MTSTAQEAPVFDLLTLDDLYELHSRLCAQEREIHATLMDGMTPLISPLSDEWKIQAARCEDITQTADAAWAEIQRRENYPANQVGPYAYIREDKNLSGE